MSHRIIISSKGSGTGGDVTSQVEYTPSHSVPEVEQFRKMRKAHKVLERLNDFLYGDGEDPYPHDEP